MTAQGNGEWEWDQFAGAIATVAGVQRGDIGRTTRLDTDLDLDSLALTEVVVLLIVDLDMETLAGDLESRDWTGVTVGDLYDEYRRSRGLEGRHSQ